jgi:hypothetical protein
MDGTRVRWPWRCALAVSLVFVAADARTVRAQPSPDVAGETPRLKDRGEGVPTSMFGIYIKRRQLILYPFLEYYRDHDREYEPAEFGFDDETEFRGRYRAGEGLIFLGYGVTDDLAVEIELAGIRASLERAPSDTSGLPPKVTESGLGDVEGQVRWRWRREDDSGPEFFSFGEVVVPHTTNKPLIGTPGWEWKVGTGVVRGFSWGTVTARAALQYEGGPDASAGPGEYAVEYLKRLNPVFRLFLAVEGSEDEVELISELQWHVGRRLIVKLGTGVGLTSKATDWAPEVGTLFVLGDR